MRISTVEGIQMLVEDFGLSAAEIGEVLGVPESTIKKWVNLGKAPNYYSPTIEAVLEKFKLGI